MSHVTCKAHLGAACRRPFHPCGRPAPVAPPTSTTRAHGLSATAHTCMYAPLRGGGRAQAKELGTDMRARRKRSVTSIIGRAKLTPEQADLLMAGSAAVRHLSMP